MQGHFTERQVYRLVFEVKDRHCFSCLQGCVIAKDRFRYF
jgi:hypothetical protein